MDELARQSEGGVYTLPQAHVDGAPLDMSFSGLKTAVVNLVHNAEQKGEAIPRSAEDCLVDVTINAFIPETYIEDLQLRIEAYRKIAGIESRDDSEDVLDELIDRFGEPPKSVVGLVNVALLRNTAARLGIKEITQKGQNIVFSIRDAAVGGIMALTKKYKGRILVNGSAAAFISIKLLPKEEPIVLMREVLDTMEKAEIE